MALFNKVGSMLRSSIADSSASNAQSSMLTGLRLMTTNLFVGGLSFNTREDSLRDAFSSYGEVVEARIITDRDSGRSRGFGFVNFANEDGAKSAQASMDGQELDGRAIGVRFAEDRPPRNNFGGGGGGYGERPPRNNFGGGGGYGERPPRNNFGGGGGYGDRE